MLVLPVAGILCCLVAARFWQRLLFVSGRWTRSWLALAPASILAGSAAAVAVAGRRVC